MSAVLVDHGVVPQRAHLRLVVDNDRPGAVGPGALPIVLTPRGRLLARLLVAALGLGLAVVVGVLVGLALRVPAGGSAGVVTVEPGDSLWSIATVVAGEDGDVREVVERIAVLNGLEQDVLLPGQSLQVPAG